MLFSLFSWSRWCSWCKDFRRKREKGVGIRVHVFLINFMLSLLPWFFSTLEEGWEGGWGGGGWGRIPVFSKLHAVKVLKKQRSHEKRIDVYMIYDFLIFMLSLLAWFFIILGKGEICSRCEHDFSRFKKKWGGGGREKGYMFFQNFMVSKYLKNRDLMKKKNWCMYDL